jgi:hypothetical protein
LQKNAALPATASLHPFCGIAWVTPSGVFSAAWAAVWVSTPVCTIRARTVLRRSSAVDGCRYGSYPVGFSTIPASVAAWGSVSLSGVVLK